MVRSIHFPPGGFVRFRVSRWRAVLNERSTIYGPTVAVPRVLTASLATPRVATSAIAASHVTSPLVDTERATSWFRSIGAHGPWIVGWASMSWLATLWSPALLAHPVLLMMLAPRAAFLMLAAPHIGLAQFVLIGTARLTVTDASWFIAGKRFPHRTGKASFLSRFRVMRWSVHISKKLCLWICSTGLLAAAVLFFRPNGKYLGVAGANGVSSRLAGFSSVLGTVVYLVAVHVGVGSFFG